MWTAASSGLTMEASPHPKSVELRYSLSQLPVTISCDGSVWASEPDEVRRYCSRFFIHYIAFSFLLWLHHAACGVLVP